MHRAERTTESTATARKERSGPCGCCLSMEGFKEERRLARRASISLTRCTACAHRLSTSDHVQPTRACAVCCLVYTPCRTLQMSRGCPPQVNVLSRRICLRQDKHMQITSLLNPNRPPITLTVLHDQHLPSRACVLYQRRGYFALCLYPPARLAFRD